MRFLRDGLFNQLSYVEGYYANTTTCFCSGYVIRSSGVSCTTSYNALRSPSGHFSQVGSMYGYDRWKSQPYFPDIPSGRAEMEVLLDFL
jgi:hypothetical protein